MGDVIHRVLPQGSPDRFGSQLYVEIALESIVRNEGVDFND